MSGQLFSFKNFMIFFPMKLFLFEFSVMTYFSFHTILAKGTCILDMYCALIFKRSDIKKKS